MLFQRKVIVSIVCYYLLFTDHSMWEGGRWGVGGQGRAHKEGRNRYFEIHSTVGMLCFEQKTLEAHITHSFLIAAAVMSKCLTKRTVHLREVMPCQQAKNTGQSGIMLDPWMYYLKPGDNENTDWNENFIVKAQKSEKDVELEKKKVQKLNWQSDAGSSSCTELNCDSPPQYQSWFCSHGVRCTLCILAGLCPCQCWHTGTTCWSCWIWWGQFHNHTERSARRPFSSGQTSSSWKSPMKTEFKKPFKCNT